MNLDTSRKLGDFCGLRILNFEAQGVALRMGWLWLSWVDPAKPWRGLPLLLDPKVKALLNVSGQFPPWQW
jgi:hypothetical protein